VRLTRREHAHLKRLSRQTTAPYAHVLRAKLLVAAFEHPHWTTRRIAQTVGCASRTVRKWRARWRATRTLADTARHGCPRLFSLGTTRPIDRTGLYAAA
jgi:transposase